MLEAHERLHRSADPDTSINAAKQIVGSVTELQLEVMRFARARGHKGFTDEELSLSHGCSGSTYRTRRAELTRAGEIVDSGKRHRMLGMKMNRLAIVWVHVEHAGATA